MNPSGLCKCGCGEKTWLATQTNTAKGWVKGEPVDYAHSHWRRNTTERKDLYVEEDRGYDTPCWIWQGHKSYRHGYSYGRISVGSKMMLAHRWLYQEIVGPVPEGQELDHLCRVTECVNPDHLEPVTHAENCRRGKRASLSYDAAREIKRQRAMPVAVLADRYGVCKQTIRNVWTGVTWKEAA